MKLDKHPELNKHLKEIDIYASKNISSEAKKNPQIINLSFGEPQFGPPEYLLSGIEQDLTINNFLDSAKRYENPKGCLKLREAIASWYVKNYNIKVDPATQIMITHGGVEAISLAILCTSNVGDTITITDPTYMLYQRTLKALNRNHSILTRPPAEYEYTKTLSRLDNSDSIQHSKAIIINSPENPTGYVIEKEEWKSIAKYAYEKNLWVIHDEVYDTMSLKRQHIPCIAVDEIRNRSIIINSFSKKFGLPGLRIGWMIANKEVIDLASKLHDYLYLGVNIQYEKIATRILSDKNIDTWLSKIANDLSKKADKVISQLGEEEGFNWLRYPSGAMFLFPNVKKLYTKIPASYKQSNLQVGESVAKYLFKEKQIAVVPGGVYGANSEDYIRMVLCTPDNDLDLAISRLKS